jgi:uncharacterized protein
VADADGVSVLAPLDCEECYRYLAGVPIGRVAVVDAGLPDVVPVNFAVLDQDIVIRTGAGILLTASRTTGLASFEADGWDRSAHTGWSVLMKGRLTELVRPAELALVATLGLDSWAPGAKGHVLRLRPSSVAGRRLVAGGPPRPPRSDAYGPDTPVASLPLRPVAAVPPAATIAEALQLLHEAQAPIGCLGGEHTVLVSTGGLVRALLAGTSQQAPAHVVAGHDVLVVPPFTALVDAVRIMSVRQVSHAVVHGERGGLGVLTVGDAVSPLLWVFDPLVTALQAQPGVSR